MPFPPPPVQGSEHIVAITSEQGLRAEGETMNHCVGSYGNSVKCGHLYVYQVLAPERATLAITLGVDELWRIGQLRLYQNQPVSGHTTDAVKAWLRNHYIASRRI